MSRLLSHQRWREHSRNEQCSLEFRTLRWLLAPAAVEGRHRRGLSLLNCVEDPRKGGSILLFLRLASFSCVLEAVEPQSGSRWSARSAARTNDLEADEDPPHTPGPRGEVKALRF